MNATIFQPVALVREGRIKKMEASSILIAI
jgi:hypothetical protein